MTEALIPSKTYIEILLNFFRIDISNYFTESDLDCSGSLNSESLHRLNFVSTDSSTYNIRANAIFILVGYAQQYPHSEGQKCFLCGNKYPIQNLL